ncbi:FtsX-like permease family protein [Parabacteroides segnis]|uniref:ABC transporter permease n=1 Tax=Parabacteroides segnis TaxID=2763058 RepID=UPI0035115B87
MSKMLNESLKNLSRFRASTILNIIGLTVAFSSFIIIMIQVRHDLSFDKHYPDVERIFELQVSDFPGKEFSPFASRLFADESIGISPEVEKGAYLLYLGELPFSLSENAEKEQISEMAAITSTNIYDIFGFKCLMGNFSDYETPNSIMISLDAARHFFGNDNPVGQRLKIDLPDKTEELIPKEMMIVAVYDNLPKNSSIPNGVLINIGDLLLGDKASTNFRTFLKTTTTHTTDVETLIEAAAPGMLYHPVDDPNHRFVRLTNIHDSYFLGTSVRLPKGNKVTVFSLLAVGILIILIAIVNFINFSMSLIPMKMRSINTRKVLGSKNGILWLQQLLDATVLTTVAFLLAILTIYLLSHSSFTGLLSADMSLSNNMILIAITFFIAIFTGIISALYPALYSTSFPPALVLKGSFGLSVKGRKLRTSLIGLQYLISITLIIVALFIRVQYEWMRNHDTGVNKENILKVELPEGLANKRKVIEAEMKNIPGVSDIAFLWGDIFNYRTINWNRDIHGETKNFTAQIVTPNFLSMMDIQVTEGRNFLESDNSDNGVLIFNETGRKMFDLSVGEKIWTVTGESAIVGFCKDFNFLPLVHPITPIALYVYGKEEAIGPLSMAYIKTNPTDISITISQIRETLFRLDPTFNASQEIEFLDKSFGNLYQKEKNLSNLVTLFSLLAVLISTIGVLGLVMFETQYRRKEIGIRKVFGASVIEILGIFNKRYVKIVTVCFVLATPLAYYIIVNWQSNFAYQAPVVAWIFGVALLITLLITMLAVTIQSYHFAVENPVRSIETI